jgi:hypothetical protein
MGQYIVTIAGIGQEREREKKKIVIYITHAVGYILQREVFRLQQDRFNLKTSRSKMPTPLVMY